jgi:hypothetical protein
MVTANGGDEDEEENQSLNVDQLAWLLEFRLFLLGITDELSRRQRENSKKKPILKGQVVFLNRLIDRFQ